MSTNTYRANQGLQKEREKENPRMRTQHISEVRREIDKTKRLLANVQSKAHQAKSPEAKKKIADLVRQYKQDIADLRVVLKLRVEATSRYFIKYV